MKKLIYFILSFLCFQLIAISNQQLSAQVLWQDNFDSDTLNQFPANWIASGNGLTSFVTDSDYVSFPYACSMQGVSGGNSEAFLYTQFDSAYSCYQFQFSYLYTGIGQIGNHFYHGEFGIQEFPTGTTPFLRNLVVFQPNFNITTFQTQSVIGTYAVNQWVKIKVIYEKYGTLVKLSYFVNDLFILSETLTAYTYEIQLQYFTLKSGDTKCLYDDVSISVYAPKIMAGHNSTICAGESITLTATGGTSFTWDHGVVQGVPFTPAATATYTVIGNSCGGFDSASVTVFVNPNPIVSISTPTNTICAGTSVTLTATGATDFLWNNNLGTSASLTVTPISTTTYSVTGTTGGCSSTANITITVNPNPVPVIVSSVNPVCAGASSVLTASGASNYVWSNGLGTSNTLTVTPVLTTTYTITATTAGCTSTSGITIIVNAHPVVGITATANPICPGASTTLTAAGASNYSWSNGLGTANNVIVTPANTTTYTVTGTTTGCTGTANITITINPTISLTSSATTICAGTSAALFANGAATYLWSNGLGTANNVIVTPATTTTYTVTGTLNGCTNTAGITIHVNPNPIVSISTPAVTICAGTAITLTASGASAYTWSNGLGTSNPLIVTPTSTITYTVTGTTTGCTGTSSITIHVNPNPIVSISVSANPICTGTSTTLTASGASNYSWSNGLGTVNTIIVTPVSTTSYTVTETLNGCTSTASITVVVNLNPTISILPSANPICAGNSATLTGTGASTYIWSNGLGTTNPVTVTPASTTLYSVTGTLNGCTGTTNITITVNPNPIVSVSASVNPICPGTSTTLTAAGASTYLWSNGLGTTNPVTATPATTTTYTVTGTMNGCTNTANITIIVNPTVTITPSTNNFCAGTSTTLTASGATTYTWCNGLGNANPLVVTPVSTTTYTVTGTMNGCTNSASIAITVNPNPVINLSSSANNICAGTSITLTAGGASTYLWSNGLGTANPVSVTPTSTTTYTVTGTSGACSGTAGITIQVNPVPTISILATANPICLGSSTTLTASGAFSYSWSPVAGLSDSTGAIVIATPGVSTTYTVVGTNGTGCSGSTTVLVDVINISAAITNIADEHCELSDGKLTVTPSGICTQGFTYVWNTIPQQTSQTAINLSAGIYNVTVYCGSCPATATAVLANIPGPSATITNVINTSCGLPNGQASAIANGGTIPYTYIWSNGQNTQTLTNVIAGNYTVTIQDAAGCTATAIDSIAPSAALLVITSSTNAGCDQANGSASVIIIQGVGSYTYLWSTDPAQSTPTSTGLYAGIYTVTVTDSLCTVTSSVIVKNFSGPQASFTANPHVLTPGESNVIFLNNSSGNIVGYLWNFGDGSPTETGQSAIHYFTNVGTYYITLTVTDTNGCSDSHTDSVTVNDIFAFYIPNSFTPNGDGLNDVFLPKGTLVDPDNYDMDIYDRWGMLVFHSSNTEKGWNGTAMNKGNPDKDIVMGVFVYKINFKDLTGKKHYYTGQINLLP